MSPSENERLTQMLTTAAAECKRLGYSPKKFLQMLNADGGFATAAKLLAAPGISDGFVQLQMLGKLNLTVEALILENGWAAEFDPILIGRAKKRLSDAGYAPPAPSNVSGPALATIVESGSSQTSHSDEIDPSLSGALSEVLRRYLSAVKEPFSKHVLADFIRGPVAGRVVSVLKDHASNLEVKGSAGIGNWARGPWVGIFDPLVTTSAQTGYYVCYLFKEDMTGVYLSLNQGMTEAKKHYKADAKTALAARALNFRAMLGPRVSDDLKLVIDLAPSAPSNDTAFYEAGNICAVYYPVQSMPDDATVRLDLARIVLLYRALIEAEIAADSALDEEGDLPPLTMLEDGTKFRLHKRIERNAKLVKLVKQAKSNRCEICDVDFGERYGPLGAGYIEAHHLRPIASIKGMKAEFDPLRDFAMLCSNCHRMVHRSGLIDDLDRFKREHFHG